MGCTRCGTDYSAIKLLLNNAINEKILSGELQAGLIDCEDKTLGHKARVMTCDLLSAAVCQLIQDGEVCIPKIGVLTYDPLTKKLSILMDDGETVYDTVLPMPDDTKISDVQFDKNTQIATIKQSDNTEFKLDLSEVFSEKNIDKGLELVNGILNVKIDDTTIVLKDGALSAVQSVAMDFADNKTTFAVGGKLVAKRPECKAYTTQSADLLRGSDAYTHIDNINNIPLLPGYTCATINLYLSESRDNKEHFIATLGNVLGLGNSPAGDNSYTQQQLKALVDKEWETLEKQTSGTVAPFSVLVETIVSKDNIVQRASLAGLVSSLGINFVVQRTNLYGITERDGSYYMSQNGEVPELPESKMVVTNDTISDTTVVHNGWSNWRQLSNEEVSALTAETFNIANYIDNTTIKEQDGKLYVEFPERPTQVTAESLADGTMIYVNRQGRLTTSPIRVSSANLTSLSAMTFKQNDESAQRIRDTTVKTPGITWFNNLSSSDITDFPQIAKDDVGANRLIARLQFINTRNQLSAAAVETESYQQTLYVRDLNNPQVYVYTRLSGNAAGTMIHNGTATDAQWGPWERLDNPDLTSYYTEAGDQLVETLKEANDKFRYTMAAGEHKNEKRRITLHNAAELISVQTSPVVVLSGINSNPPSADQLKLVTSYATRVNSNGTIDVSIGADLHNNSNQQVIVDVFSTVKYK